MTEEFLQYVWANSLFTSTVCMSTKGKRVEILNVGFQNRDAGPDFFNAKVRINDVVQVGNVEIHQKGSDWFRHAHEKDLPIIMLFSPWWVRQTWKCTILVVGKLMRLPWSMIIGYGMSMFSCREYLLNPVVIDT